eukprot:6172612-Pleurochrysis_carterae.AAC.1
MDVMNVEAKLVDALTSEGGGGAADSSEMALTKARKLRNSGSAFSNRELGKGAEGGNSSSTPAKSKGFKRLQQDAQQRLSTIILLFHKSVKDSVIRLISFNLLQLYRLHDEVFAKHAPNVRPVRHTFDVNRICCAEAVTDYARGREPQSRAHSRAEATPCTSNQHEQARTRIGSMSSPSVMSWVGVRRRGKVRRTDKQFAIGQVWQHGQTRHLWSVHAALQRQRAFR